MHRREDRLGGRILIVALCVGMTLLGNGALAATDDDATPGFPFSGKGAYSLLLAEDLPAQSPGEIREGAELPPQQAAPTERLFSLDFPKLLFSDAKYVLAAPLGWESPHWLTFLGVALGVGAAAFLDKPIQTLMERNQNSSTHNTAEDIRCFGGACSFAALGLFYAGGALLHDETAKAVAIDGAAASLVASGIIAPALKYMVGRARPNADKGTHYFTPLSSSNESFPSGETTQAFAVASVIATHYDDLWAKAFSYGIASLVGMARIYENAHWTSDAAAGALIGTAVGITVVRFNERRRKAKKETGLFITPLLAPGMGGVALTLVR